MMRTADFPLEVVANVCEGPAALRVRLVDRGLDLATIARLVQCPPLTLARATRTGSSPRGVLVGLATLVAVLDRLEAQGLGPADVARADAAQVVGAIAGESTLAARMIERLRREVAPGRVSAQLVLDVGRRRAA